ncbi:MAG: hypothetical protein ACI9P5_002569 [Saprospiraceae bacterium]|jgi:hypothetical protein
MKLSFCGIFIFVFRMFRIEQKASFQNRYIYIVIAEDLECIKRQLSVLKLAS